MEFKVKHIQDCDVNVTRHNMLQGLLMFFFKGSVSTSLLTSLLVQFILLVHNTRTDQRPPAHLSCTNLLQYKRQKKKTSHRPPRHQFQRQAKEQALSVLPELAASEIKTF